MDDSGQTVDGLTATQPGLATICRAALSAGEASSVTIWRSHADEQLLSPYVRLSATGNDSGGGTLESPARDRCIAVSVGEVPGLAAGLATGGPFTLTDAAALGLGSLSGQVVWCQPIPGLRGDRRAAGVVIVEAGADATSAGALPAQPPGTAAIAALTVLAAAVSAWWGSGRTGPAGPTEALLRDLADAGRHLEPKDLLQLACRRLAEMIGAQRASVFAEDEPGQVRLRLAVLADGSNDEAAWLAAGPHPGGPALVAKVLASGHAETATYDPTDDPSEAPAVRAAPARAELRDWWGQALGVSSALAVPLGERAVLVLHGGDPHAFGAPEVELALAVSAHLRDAAVAIRRRRESLEHETTASGLRQLLEAGVRACSPMEAAEALAAAAIKVIGLPMACAYLVDPNGMISEVATVGASAAKADALRASLIGKPAAGSPVWRRTVEGDDAGPDLISDTAVAGLVRPGGVAEVLGLRSLATIPLLSSDGPLGLVLCGAAEPRPQWRARDRQMLAQLALEGTVVVDNARLREAERHEANHDPLTGLLNRRAFYDRFREALATSRRSGRPLAVLVLDLDRFKEVNDHFGHHSGDQLLVEVGARLRASCRPQDVLGRLGGDEFAFVVECDGGAADASAVAARIEAALGAPMTLGGTTLSIEVSIGIALVPNDGESVADLLRRADLAMYTAKRSGHGTQIYQPEMRTPTSRLGLLADLRGALRRCDELVLHYQPKVDLSSGRITGVEALVRWDHPAHGLLSPDCFVPLAEDSGLIGALTAWVVPTALRQLAAWQAQGHDLRLSVNVSARDVANPDLPKSVGAWLDAAGVHGTSLVVEVTEGALLKDGAETTAVLGSLRRLGVEVSLDDFGTGYSSLAYLESLSIDEIKADRQFLRIDTGERAVLRSIITLGHELGVRVVAEGVEAAADVEWLITAGCDEAQGYHFSRPVEAEGIVALLDTLPAVPAIL